MTPTQTRRTFLKLSSSLGATVLLPACGDKNTSDSTPATADSAAGEALTLSKVPWVSFQGDGTARLRFETREEQAARVTVLVGDTPADAVPELSAETLDYSWADNEDVEEDLGIVPDKPGLHVIQEVVLSGLPTDVVVAWTVDLGGGVAYEGTFRTDPGPDATFVLGWIADTMFPNNTDTLAVLAQAGADVVVHGGDIQYQSNPLDTWSGFFSLAQAVTAQAASHFVVGNHEFEDQGEITVMYERLVSGQGEGSARYFRFRYGGICFICLDTETGDLHDADSEQRQWLLATLEEADADDSIRAPVVCMHRPFFTFSKHWPSTPTIRDAIHPLLRKHGVKLVLAGHAHCYERFEVDGVQYITDGGGGSFLYDSDESLEEVKATRPEEVALRVAESQTYGVCRVTISPSGYALERLNIDGEVVDSVSF